PTSCQKFRWTRLAIAQRSYHQRFPSLHKRCECEINCAILRVYSGGAPCPLYLPCFTMEWACQECYRRGVGMVFKSLCLFVQRYHFILLVVTCSLLFGITSLYYITRPIYPTGDEPHYLIISQTLIKYHSLNVSLDYKNGDYWNFYPGRLEAHVTLNQRQQLLPI